MAFDIKALANTLIDIVQIAAPLLLPGVASGPLGLIANKAIDGLQNAVLHPDVAGDPVLAPKANETLEELVTRVEANADKLIDELGDRPAG